MRLLPIFASLSGTLICAAASCAIRTSIVRRTFSRVAVRVGGY